MRDILLQNSSVNGHYQTINELLEDLIVQVKRQDCSIQQRQLILRQLVKGILRSRSICRSYQGQMLFGIYQEIYDLLVCFLTQEIDRELDKYNLQPASIDQWANKLRDRAIKAVLNDLILKKLGLSAQQYPVRSELRRYALGELIQGIRCSGKLCRPHREKFSPQFYELLYEEAVIETLIYVCTNIDKYDPERGNKKFMNWVNFRLDKSILECRRKFSNINLNQLPSLGDLDFIVCSEEPPLLSEILRQCIEEDSGKIYQNKHIKNHRYASFQRIALSRFAGKSWKEISAELSIDIPTLSSFFQRCCIEFAPRFRQELQS